MSRILVTGGAGFIGSAVARELLGRGHRVAVLTRRGPGSRLAGLAASLDLLTGDLKDLESLRPGIQAFAPEVVVHTAWEDFFGSARQDPTQARNVAQATALMDLTARLGARHWMGFGSQAEYGSRTDSPSEDTPARPDSLYGEAKVACHAALGRRAVEGGLAFTWLRLYSAYGPGNDDRWLLPTVIRQLLAGGTPRLNTSGLQSWDYIHIDDVGRAAAELVEKGSRGVYNLGSGHAEPLRGILESVRDMIDPSADIEFGPAPADPSSLPCLMADITKLRAATGWSPQVELRKGLASTVEAARRLMEG